MTLWQGYLSVWKNYFNFKGRARRTEFWGFNIISTIISFVWGFCNGVVGAVSGITENYILYNLLTYLSYLYTIAVFIPLMAVYVRRLHDVNKSGWNLLWWITIIGAIPVIIWLCKDGVNTQTGENKYGADPKSEEEKVSEESLPVETIWCSANGEIHNIAELENWLDEQKGETK